MRQQRREQNFHRLAFIAAIGMDCDVLQTRVRLDAVQPGWPLAVHAQWIRRSDVEDFRIRILRNIDHEMTVISVVPQSSQPKVWISMWSDCMCGSMPNSRVGPLQYAQIGYAGGSWMVAECWKVSVISRP